MSRFLVAESDKDLVIMTFYNATKYPARLYLNETFFVEIPGNFTYFMLTTNDFEDQKIPQAEWYSNVPLVVYQSKTLLKKHDANK